MMVDFLIVGGGIAGAGLAYFLAPYGQTMLLEKEDQLAYHTTGRSAAFYAETYGGPAVQPLTTASKAFLRAPDARYFDHPILTDRGAVHVFTPAQEAQARTTFQALHAALPSVRWLDADALRARVPYIGAQFSGGIDDPECGDLDVAALHQGFVRGCRAQGGVIERGCAFRSAERRGGRWHVITETGQIEAKVIINAAGAWADMVAESSGVPGLNIQPYRRTLATCAKVQGLEADPHGPVVLDVEEAFYFKPEGDGFLMSPADQTKDTPRDAHADDLDVAYAVDAFEKATGRRVDRVTASWAGLRSFAPDRQPVIGFDVHVPGFFWSAGQGGWGIQTAPAWSALAASLVTGRPPVEGDIDLGGIDAQAFSPARFNSGG